MFTFIFLNDEIHDYVKKKNNFIIQKENSFRGNYSQKYGILVVNSIMQKSLQFCIARLKTPQPVLP